MSESGLVVVHPRVDQFKAIVSLVTDAVRSEHSKRAYAHALVEFLSWMRADHYLLLSKRIVEAYLTALQRHGLAPASINVRLSAIRKLAREGADNGMFSEDTAAAIERVKGIRVSGVRFGNWLSKRQAERLLALPDKSTNKGKRDRVILGLMIGCGLRREELAGLEFEHIQEREGRSVIVDLSGKGNRIRTIPIPTWAGPLLGAWSEVLGTATGHVVRRINKLGVVKTEPVTPQAIYKVVRAYGEQLGIRIAPHDLRRTFAKLAHRGRSPVEQIKFSLGHSSVRTTERYLGTEQNLIDAPADHLGLDIPGEP
jgi:site-specific recombinase XerD